jgi:fatty acid desaturase
MLMSVPSYNLLKMHKVVKANGFYDKGLLENGYWEILKMAVKHP